MAIGMYPIPPPDPQILANIFGTKFSEDPDNMTPSPSSRSPRQSQSLFFIVLLFLNVTGYQVFNNLIKSNVYSRSFPMW